MTDVCPITQLSTEQQKRWPNLHNALIGELEFPTSAEIPPEALARLNDDIHDMLHEQLEKSKKDKSRDKLFKFLKQILEYRFPGSKLDKFGSSVTGLSLAQGDLDLCLQISGTVPNRIFNKIGRVLRQHDFVDIVVIPHAKVPIVKCRDARTGIPLDISVNNTLALHNTQLLKTYSMQDARVSQTILAIKYWAMCRDVSDAPSGTLSSYSWSLLSIQSMQMTTPPLVANVQTGKKRNIQHVEGDDYDVTIHPNPMSLLKQHNQQTLGEIVVNFFETFANWDWSSDICSIRNGAALSREEKGWLEQDPTAIEIIINEESKRVGKHSLAIEDPFDLRRDLSTVLRAEGVMDIHEEILRMWFGICHGDSWQQLCAVRNPDKHISDEKLDLFHDLRNKGNKEVNASISDYTTQLEQLEKKIEICNDERKKIQKIPEITNLRDEIQKKILIPAYRIEAELVRIYQRLTGEVDIFRVPSIITEENDFSLFFELQEMLPKAREADKLHSEFVELVRKQSSTQSTSSSDSAD
jgi:DNA polymerase sigma